MNDLQKIDPPEKLQRSLFRVQNLAPKFWLFWLAMALLRIIVYLPQGGRMAVGRVLGQLLYYLASRRRRIAQRNLEICFPEKSIIETKRLLKTHFHSLGQAMIEHGMAWWLSNRRLQALTHFEGLEYIKQTQEAGHGVILLSAHFTSLELGNRLLTSFRGEKLDAMYQRHKSHFMENFIQYYREQHMGHMIPEDDIRQVIRILKARGCVWYASDQGYHGKYSAAVPFFGIPVMTNTALSRLAQMGKAKVIPFFTQRLANNQGYLLKILPPIENFPSEDEVSDALAYHKLIEQQIQQVPEQYLWVHRRFKYLPPGKQSLY
ncbi:MAG: LpxL/LpxP family Kdo(2)-lipid IV(A) lauroyl/palmitoleoyl acyltransferase [Gammaproteobacteria bacterium]|nr:LpxL/LpxP family Kdo(2)-lipid IV(A) lauroyl/palmitoleoyl acyltransferase [Gammaproteobacteria bacterium]